MMPYDVAAMSCDVTDVCTTFSHVLTCCAMVVRRLTTSYEIAQESYDFNRVQKMTSASWQTIIVKSYDLIRLSYDGRTMSYYLHTIIYVPTIVPNASQPHIFQFDHKTKIVIS